MTTVQRLIKYFAIGLAAMLIVGILTGAVGLLYGIDKVVDWKREKNPEVAEKQVEGETQTIDLSETDITRLDIELAYAQLYMKKGDTFKVDISDEQITAEQKNGTLMVRDSLHPFWKDGGIVTISIPEGMHFDAVSIENGAGVASIEWLDTEQLDLEVGAGVITLENLMVNISADVETGAGALQIQNGTIRNLHMELGVGKTEIQAALVGECDVETGMGSLDVNVLGEREAYTLQVEKGLGELTVDGESITKNTTLGDGRNELHIEGGIGRIAIEFQ